MLTKMIYEQLPEKVINALISVDEIETWPIDPRSTKILIMRGYLSNGSLTKTGKRVAQLHRIWRNQ